MLSSHHPASASVLARARNPLTALLVSLRRLQVSFSGARFSVFVRQRCPILERSHTPFHRIASGCPFGRSSDQRSLSSSRSVYNVGRLNYYTAYSVEQSSTSVILELFVSGVEKVSSCGDHCSDQQRSQQSHLTYICQMVNCL